MEHFNYEKLFELVIIIHIMGLFNGFTSTLQPTMVSMLQTIHNVPCLFERWSTPTRSRHN
jgi:hypothetical protein